MSKYTKKEYKKYLQLLKTCENPFIRESEPLTFEEWKKNKKEADEILGVFNQTLKEMK